MHTITRKFLSVLLTIGGTATALGVDNPPAASPPTALSAAAAAPEASTGGPKIQFASPVYEFGKVQSGEVVKYSFVFTNAGDQLLEVTAVQPSCGCTTAGDWSRKVPVGQTGNVPIQFNSANFNGQVF